MEADPDLVSVSGGMKIVGQSSTHRLASEGLHPGKGPVLVKLRSASSPTLRTGRLISACGCLFVALALVGLILATAAPMVFTRRLWQSLS